VQAKSWATAPSTAMTQDKCPSLRIGHRQSPDLALLGDVGLRSPVRRVAIGYFLCSTS
jgi:hypothetical protein